METSILTNSNRIGNFTSSEVYRLMCEGKIKGSFGKPALTYIAEKNWERKLGRSISSEINSRPTSYGNLVELQAFNLLGLNYKISSQETYKHGSVEYWSGSPDGVKFNSNGEIDAVFDVKSPFTLKSFCELADCNTTDELRENHTDGEKYYWQLVSNAILTGAKYAELIVYVPYQKELAAIRELANNWEGNPNKIAWVNWAEDADLPYLIEDRHYKNVHILRFEVSDADKKLLTDRVIEAGKLLEAFPVAKYAPTEEQRLTAQEKIALMKELATRLKSNKKAIAA